MNTNNPSSVDSDVSAQYPDGEDGEQTTVNSETNNDHPVSEDGLDSHSAPLGVHADSTDGDSLLIVELVAAVTAMAVASGAAYGASRRGNEAK